MPYMDGPYHEGDEWCNYKKNADGSRGEKVGCSDSEEKARSALRALNMAMAEENKMMMRPTQEEVHYMTLSTTANQACANCRWFKVEGYEDDMKEEIEGGYCHLIANWPDNVLPTGHCDRWEAKPAMPEPEPLEVVIVADERAMPETSEAPTPEIEYYVPPIPEKGFLQKVKSRLTSGLQPGQTMLRDAEGRRYMVIVTSSYQDREDEALMAKALKRYADSCWPAEDYFKSNNIHQVWHHDGLTVGDIVWADMQGPFLLEISKERGDVISQKAWDYWESEEGSKDLGASPRYWYRKSDKGADGSIPLISKFETSTLPRQAAANLLTFSGVIPMSKSRDEYLDKMFGVPGAAEMLKEGPEKLAKALAEAGVQHKSTDEPTPEEAAQTAQNSFGALLLQVVDDVAGMHEAFDKLAETADQKSLEQKAALDKLTTQLKALADDNSQLQEAMKQAPRASESEDTVVTNPELVAKIKAQTAKADAFFGGALVED